MEEDWWALSLFLVVAWRKMSQPDELLQDPKHLLPPAVGLVALLKRCQVHIIGGVGIHDNVGILGFGRQQIKF